MKRFLAPLLTLTAVVAAWIVPDLVAAQEKFIPLTSIPAFQDIQNTDGFSALLNGIYRLAIGAAAVLAVLQIFRSGMTYMLGDSITEKKEARQHIVMAIVGLVLVLSPYIVFSIIDPRILSLEVDIAPIGTPGPGGPGDAGTPGDSDNPDGGGDEGEDPDDGNDPDDTDPSTPPPPPPPSGLGRFTGSYAVLAGGEGWYTNLSDRQITEDGVTCYQLQAIDYTNAQQSLALARCNANANSATARLGKCVPEGQTISLQLTNACAINGKVRLFRSQDNR